MLFTAVLATMVAMQSDVVITPARINRVPPEAQITTLQVRIHSPEGVLWQGPVRISRNQGVSYQQSLSQAFTDVCPPDSGYDRSERRSINFNIYSQSSQRGPQYRVDVSWARPILDASCGETGTRTVQINQTVFLDANQTQTVEGDAGLKVEISRR